MLLLTHHYVPLLLVSSFSNSKFTPGTQHDCYNNKRLFLSVMISVSNGLCDRDCPITLSSSDRSRPRQLVILCCNDDSTLVTQLYRFLLTSNPSISSQPHSHVAISFRQPFPRTKHPAILYGKTPRNFGLLLLYLPIRYPQTPG